MYFMNLCCPMNIFAYLALISGCEQLYNFILQTSEEFVGRMNGFRITNETKIKPAGLFTPPGGQLPENVDWREKGYVTPVKDQVGFECFKLRTMYFSAQGFVQHRFANDFLAYLFH